MSESNKPETGSAKGGAKVFFAKAGKSCNDARERIGRFCKEHGKIVVPSVWGAGILLFALFCALVNDGMQKGELIDRVAFTVFGMEIYWYAIVIVFGMVLALFVFMHLSKELSLKSDDGITLFLIAIPLGIVFARVGYVISHTSEFFPINEFADVFNIIWTRNGGVTILGGIPGGFLGAYIFARHKKVRFLELVGAAAMPLLLAQAIGRWGNFFNQEVYGEAVAEGSKFFQTFPFGVFIETEGAWRYATFFYESFLSVIGSVLLYYLFKRVKYKGTVAFGYLAWYFLSRAIVESMRTDGVPVGGSNLSWGVLLSLIVFPVAILLGIVYYRNGSLKRLSFKKLPETEESAQMDITAADNAEYDENSGAVKEKTEAGRQADLKRKYYGNKKK
ncbi:MAG: prolipoprotein diacylglyceryl transferase [Clostridiales bacterium]|jgi:phosphatidylglycerol:prolipoprotein diacylglycerol transferase|nr:prolipoprotein diacylglyceryl transferase [Clostridiales bacterium]